MKFPLLLTAFIVSTILPAVNGAVAGEPLETLIVREKYLPTPPREEMAAAIRDPFNWPERQERRFQALTRKKLGDVIARISLDGIIYSPQKPLALINGQVLTINDTIEGYRLTKITPDRITLRHGKVKRTMRLAMPSLRLDIKGK